MIKQRIVSGLILGSIILVVVIFASGPWFALASLVLFGIGGWEWGRLTSVESIRWRVGYLLTMAVIVGGLWTIVDSDLSNLWLGLSIVFWLLMVILLRRYHRDSSHQPRWQGWLQMAGLIVVPAAWLAFVKLHALHYGWLLYALILSATSDSMAYFVGKTLGRRKLAPELSPGKTMEGFAGGMTAVMVLSLFTAWLIGFSIGDTIAFVLLSLVTGLFSVEGDLFESLIKREAGVKDSGSLLPGHGGVLDRFDSHLSAAPLFFIGLSWVLQ